MSGVLFHSVEDVSAWFDESEGRLPVFRGSSIAESASVWRALNLKDRWLHWRQAAIAASIDRAAGQRTGETPIQEFARTIGVGPEYVSRWQGRS